MKPCIACGHPIANNTDQCDRCQAAQSAPAKHELPKQVDPSEDTITAVDVVAFLVEMMIRIVLLGVFTIPVCIGILVYLLPVIAALIAGTIIGIAISVAYTLFEFHFRNQSP